MRPALNETHNPTIKSWVDSANQRGTDFPIQNLPFGIYRRRGSGETPHMCVAIGDYALDVASCDADGLFRGLAPDLSKACRSSSLNRLMSLGRSKWSALRGQLHGLLRANGHDKATARDAAERHLVPIDEVELLLPAKIGDYTDFYASIDHAMNVGSIFRPDTPLTPNYKYMPIGYHGRASSIVVSGTPVRRPLGQTRPSPSEPVRFGPVRQLDYEAEIGFFVGPGNELGMPISMEDAESHIFGLCIVNDWSARDIQSWESQPLGPFLAKNFATTISPWVVTVEALSPFRVPTPSRSQSDPDLLPYLLLEGERNHSGIDIHLEVLLSSQKMREQGCSPIRLSRGTLRDLYWTPAQMLTHHTSNGCNLRPGDLFASGTISGKSKDTQGCLLELTRRGNDQLRLPTGETRRFLEDGDEVIMLASCETQAALRIGFGSCRGSVQSSIRQAE
jgi:fumarylacetoacetase